MSDGEFSFAVDLPNPHDYDAEWVNCDYFETREKAIAWAQQHLGADAEGRICVVSEIPQEAA